MRFAGVGAISGLSRTPILPEDQVPPLSQGSVEHTRLKNWKNNNIHPLEAFICVLNVHTNDNKH